MTLTLLSALLIALLSSLSTLGLAWLFYDRRLRAQLDAEVLRLQDEFERRVKQGVIAAGTELLPALREQVALGFRDALKESRAAGLVEDTAKVVTGGADLLEKSLGNLFGLKPRR